MSLFPFRRLLVGALGAALTLAVLVSVPGTAPAAAPAAAVDPSQVTVTGLKVNGRTNPLGIPGGAPSFSWHGESAARGVVQTAYQIQVATSAAKLSNPDIWNSNRKTSNRQVDVLYQGAVGLTSQTRYFWRVRTWDGQDNISDWSDVAWFETGMLSPADWGGAEWIGAPDGDERPRWHDYTADFTFTIDNLAFGAFVRSPAVNHGPDVADLDRRRDATVPAARDGSNGSYNLLDNKDISSVVSVAEALRSGPHTEHHRHRQHVLHEARRQVDRHPDRPGRISRRGPVGLRTAGAEAATVHRVRVMPARRRHPARHRLRVQQHVHRGRLVPGGGLKLEGDENAMLRMPTWGRHADPPARVLDPGGQDAHPSQDLCHCPGHLSDAPQRHARRRPAPRAGVDRLPQALPAPDL